MKLQVCKATTFGARLGKGFAPSGTATLTSYEPRAKRLNSLETDQKLGKKPLSDKAQNYPNVVTRRTLSAATLGGRKKALFVDAAPTIKPKA